MVSTLCSFVTLRGPSKNSYGKKILNKSEIKQSFADLIGFSVKNGAELRNPEYRRIEGIEGETISTLAKKVHMESQLVFWVSRYQNFVTSKCKHLQEKWLSMVSGQFF